MIAGRRLCPPILPQGVSGGRRGNRVHPSSRSANNSVESLAAATTIRLSPMSVVAVMATTASSTPTSSPRKGRKEDGCKEVGRR